MAEEKEEPTFSIFELTRAWKMLSDKEKEGCKAILNKLSRQDLITLTDTVTNRLVSPENTSGKILKLKVLS